MEKNPLMLIYFMFFVSISAYENLALYKPTWQQYPYSERPDWGSDKAVDGLYTDLSAGGGQCTISAEKKSIAEWRVHLGGVFSIHHISIQHRTDNLDWDERNDHLTRFLGFSVFLSNTTDKNDGVLCFHDKNYLTVTIPNHVNIPCRYHGRYVIYYNNRTHPPYPDGYSKFAYNELCEVEVYGCVSQKYGESCSIQCPQHCLGVHCDIVTGACLGCVPGYTGEMCTEECQNNTYGLKCTENCGKCMHGEQCHHINGSCLDGCDKGRKGVKCNQVCPVGRYGYNCQKNCSINCFVPERCNRVTGLCEGGCQVGWSPPTCDTIKTEHPSATAPGSHLIAVVIPLAVFLFVSVVINIISLIVKVRRLSTTHQERNTRTENTDQPIPTISNNMYAIANEDNAVYQELGELNNSATYARLKCVCIYLPCLRSSKKNMDALLHLLVIVTQMCFYTAYENLALNKPARQQSPFSETYWGADKAVDGRYTDLSAGGGQCTISAARQSTAEWWVDLRGVFSVHRVFIQYRTDNRKWDESNDYTGRFLGFSVYISNSTYKEDGTLCFKGTNYTRATIPNPVNMICPYHGRYVIYYNNRTHAPYPVGYSSTAWNEICELDVIGCPTPGYYGENCSIPCPKNCQDGQCNIVEGTCLRCLTGYKEQRCNEQCKDNTYGMECTNVCGNCLNGEQYNHVNGSCPDGCDKGTHGDKCDIACPSGLYWYNCLDTCSINCGVPGRCDRVTGQCEGGCQVGWRGTTCDTECDDGRYGQNCSSICGFCLNKEQCDVINGTCMNGCDIGYSGDFCTHSCKCARSSISDWNPHNPVIYILSALLSVAVVVISALIVKLRSFITRDQKYKQENKYKERDQTKKTETLYETTEDTAGYQELGEFRDIPNYDKLT
uniref:Uncharacterized protein LOC111113986 n=1 Tax=Crassostrea virginica TaxID=6565 RepID=A0A8B8BXF9_CRAVI|nr:uncharacterized protein LOC111113986 [Crassostrea virginica]